MMTLNAWPVLLVAPVILGLVAAYPHRAEVLKGYREELEGPATEKSTRHIDGLDGVQRVQSAKELEQVMRQMENQMKDGNGKWSINYSEYSSSNGGGGSGAMVNNAPIRATVTGEAIEGGDAIIGVSTNCRNCRMRVRKVGFGGPVSDTEGSVVQGAAGSYSSESSRHHQYNSRAEGGYAGQAASSTRDAEFDRLYSPSRPLGLSSGSGVGSSSHVIKTSRVVEQTEAGQAGGAGGVSAFSGLSGFGSDLNGSSGSSRKEVKVTKSSWNLSDLGYGTSSIEDIMRKLEEDLKSGRFENGKTVTTVTTSSSLNGEPPVVHKETFIKDGFDSSLTGGNSINIGRSEIEDLMLKLREDLRAGKTQSGKTVTTVVTTTSVNGERPIVKKETFVKDGFDGSPLENLGVGSEFEGFETGSGGSGSSSRKIVKTTHTRKVYSTQSGGALPGTDVGSGSTAGTVHSYSSQGTSSGIHRGSGNTHETRTVDSLGGGHLIRETGLPGRFDQVTAASYDAVRPAEMKPERQESSTYHKETRRVERLGGSHVTTDTEVREPAPSSGSTSSLSVAQMKGYRRTSPDDEDTGIPAGGSYASRSKYYSSFDSTSALNSAGSYGAGGPQPDRLPSSVMVSGGQQVASYGGTASPGAAGVLKANGGSQVQHSASSYRKSVQYGGQGAPASGTLNRERDLDHLGGGHLLRDVNPYGGQASTVHAQTENSQGKIERQQGQGFSSYSVAISGSSGTGNGEVNRAEHLSTVPAHVPSYGSHVQQAAQTDITGNQAFINAEQGASRIPEADSVSYFSSHHKMSSATSGISGVNPGAPVGTITVPVAPAISASSTDQRVDSSYGLYGVSDGGNYKSERRVDRLGDGHLIKRVDGVADSLSSGGPTATSSGHSYSRKVDWSSSAVQTFGATAATGENFDTSGEDFPNTRNAAPTSPSIKLGYGTGNGGYGGPARSRGQLSTSLLDLGISPSYGSQRQPPYGSSSHAQAANVDGSFGASGGYGYGSSGGYSSSSSSRRYEKTSSGYGAHAGLSAGESLGSQAGGYPLTVGAEPSGSYGSHAARSSGYRAQGSYSSGAGSAYQRQTTGDGQDCEQRGGHLLRDTWSLDNPPCRQRRGGLDSLSGATFGGAKKRFNSLSGAAFGTAKRNFDEIDRTPFNSFTKKNFDEIDRAGFDTFVKRAPEVDDFPIYNMPAVIPRVAALYAGQRIAQAQEESP